MKVKELLMHNKKYYFSKEFMKQNNIDVNNGILVFNGNNILKFKIKNDKIITILKTRIQPVSNYISSTPFFIEEKRLIIGSKIDMMYNFIENPAETSETANNNSAVNEGNADNSDNSNNNQVSTSTTDNNQVSTSTSNIPPPPSDDDFPI